MTDRVADGLSQPHALHRQSCPARTLAGTWGHLSMASSPPRALEASPEFNKVIKQLSPGTEGGSRGAGSSQNRGVLGFSRCKQGSFRIDL